MILFLIIFFLVIASTLLFLIDRQEKIREYNKNSSSRGLRDKNRCLQKIKEDTRKRLEFEKNQLRYQNTDKKGYL